MSDRYVGRGPPHRSSPPRERPPPRNRDDHPDVEYFGAGESYRPGGNVMDGMHRTPRDRERDAYNPERRDDRRRDDIDSYIPPTSSRAPRTKSRSPPPYRRRSRSPPGRNRSELFPERNRSPPRRYSPARENRPRSPPHRRSRSPYHARARTPENRRPRDLSPVSAARSPFRDRLDSPRNRPDRPRSPPRRQYSPPRDTTYRPRSRTPPRRDDRRPNYADETWRRRSPSPRTSRPVSGTTSRRSSPPGNHDRASLAGSGLHSPANTGRPQYDTRRNESYSTRPRSPLRNGYLHRSERDEPTRHETYTDINQATPSAPRSASYDQSTRDLSSREHVSAQSPPTGPSGVQASMPTQQHGPTATTFSASMRGRGGRYDGPSRDFVSPPGAVRGRTSITYRAPGYRPPTTNDSTSAFATASSTVFPNSAGAPSVPPAGPRASSYSARGDYGRGGFAPIRSEHSSGLSRQNNHHPNTDLAFRGQGNTLATAYPRAQRFNDGPIRSGVTASVTTFNTGSPTTTNSIYDPIKFHLSTLERIVPGGRRLPSGLPPEQEKRIKQLEEDAERLRIDLMEKQKKKREALSGWDIREREIELAGLRSELAEGHLRMLSEEESLSANAAF